ncbi:ADP-dependent NAD(P)H-hydrate dehydratase [Compostimonas suwonensis]|nr:ADP/ATP-dependent (S)-NAD(P)H-hydrate dehydratase [Compostimonas suwonensis]
MTPESEAPALWSAFGVDDARAWIAVPADSDDKYSRGVLGVMTGSTEYPGAAVLGVEAAVRTGLGMVRYLGPERPTGLVLARRPEAVTVDGRVQAWLLGSGMATPRPDEQVTAQLERVLAQGRPAVLDAGALDLVGAASAPVVVTPHYRELARLLGDHGRDVTVEAISGDPARWAVEASRALEVTVLLKGSTTHVADARSGRYLLVSAGPAWLATAGSGDVLGGILGALLATHSEAIESDAGALAQLAATAVVLHGRAAERACPGGPVAALDIAEALPAVVAELVG